MKYKPYPYQQRFIDEIKENLADNKHVLGQMCTRSGKSVPLCYFAELGYKHNKPVLIIVHTGILLSQISQDLIESGIPHGIIKAGHYESRDIVQVASVQTLYKRKEKYPSDFFKLCMFDETHMIMAKTFLSVRQYFDSAKWLGLTATPRRLDNSGFRDAFDVLVSGISKLELIKMNRLVPTMVASPLPSLLGGLKVNAGDFTKSSQEKALHEKFLHGEYVEHYFTYGISAGSKKKKGLVFCPTVDFAREVTAAYNSNGISAVEISARDSKKVRDQKLTDYYNNKYLLLVSVDLFLVGFTIKEAEIIIGLRDTMSIVIWFQMIGRGSMIAPGKTELIFVDTCNTMFRIGHPDLEPEWSLDGETKEERIMNQANISARIVRCDNCRWSYDITMAKHTIEGAVICPRCGQLKENKGRMIKTIDGKLQLVSSQDWEKYELQKKWEIEQEWIADQTIEREKAEKRLEVRNASTREALLEIAKKRGYSQKWVEYRLMGKAQARAKYGGKSYGDNINKGNNTKAVKPIQNNTPIF